MITAWRPFAVRRDARLSAVSPSFCSPDHDPFGSDRVRVYTPRSIGGTYPQVSSSGAGASRVYATVSRSPANPICGPLSIRPDGGPKDRDVHRLPSTELARRTWPSHSSAEWVVAVLSA